MANLLLISSVKAEHKQKENRHLVSETPAPLDAAHAGGG